MVLSLSLPFNFFFKCVDLLLLFNDLLFDQRRVSIYHISVLILILWAPATQMGRILPQQEPPSDFRLQLYLLVVDIVHSTLMCNISNLCNLKTDHRSLGNKVRNQNLFFGVYSRDVSQLYVEDAIRNDFLIDVQSVCRRKVCQVDA